MDTTDIKILRIMGLRPYSHVPQNTKVFKPSYIAEKIGLDPKTIKIRIKRMEKAGIIHFYQIYPNFRHLNVNGAGYLFRVKDEDRKLKLIKLIENVAGLTEVHNFLGKDLCVDINFHTNNDLSKKLRILSEFIGDAKPTPFYHRHMPTINRKLSLLDWRILKALRYNALRSLDKVAAQLKVSLKTVKRRLDRMAKEGSFFIVPALDLSKAKGLILFELLIYTSQHADNLTIQRILKTTEENYVYHYLPISQTLGNFDMILFAESTAEIGQLRQAVCKIHGVEKADALILQGWSDFTGWIDSAVQEKIDVLVQNREK